MTLEQIAQAVRTVLPQGGSLAEIDQYLTENHVEHRRNSQDLWIGVSRALLITTL